jgi:hypothetical protein
MAVAKGWLRTEGWDRDGARPSVVYCLIPSNIQTSYSCEYHYIHCQTLVVAPTKHTWERGVEADSDDEAFRLASAAMNKSSLQWVGIQHEYHILTSLQRLRRRYCYPDERARKTSTPTTNAPEAQSRRRPSHISVDSTAVTTTIGKPHSLGSSTGDPPVLTIYRRVCERTGPTKLVLRLTTVGGGAAEAWQRQETQVWCSFFLQHDQKLTTLDLENHRQ